MFALSVVVWIKEYVLGRPVILWKKKFVFRMFGSCMGK